MTVTTLIRLAVAASLAASLAPAQGVIVKKKKDASEARAEQSAEQSVQERIVKALKAIDDDELTPAQRKKVMAKLQEALARLEKGGEAEVIVVEGEGETHVEPKLLRWNSVGTAVELTEAEKGAWVMGGKDGAQAKGFAFRAQDPKPSTEKAREVQKQLEAATKRAKEAQQKVEVLLKKLGDEHRAIELQVHGAHERALKALEETVRAAEHGEHGAMFHRLQVVEGEKAAKLGQVAEELRARLVEIEPQVLEFEGGEIEIRLEGLEGACEDPLRPSTAEAEEIVEYEVEQAKGDSKEHRVWLTPKGKEPAEVDVKVDQRKPARTFTRELPAHVDVRELHEERSGAHDADLREMIEQMRAELREMRAMIRDIQRARATQPASRDASDRAMDVRRARRARAAESHDAPTEARSPRAGGGVVSTRPVAPAAPVAPRAAGGVVSTRPVAPRAAGGVVSTRPIAPVPPVPPTPDVAPTPEVPVAPVETVETVESIETVEVAEPPAPPSPVRALRLRR